MNTLTRRVLAPLALICAVALSGCAAFAPTDPEHDTQVALEHIHGLAADPATGDVLIASHGGLYTLTYALDEGATFTSAEPEAAGPIAGNDFDAMGFTVVGDVMYASGHPGPGSPDHFGASNLGLIRSDDSGQTWENISRTGDADFHDLAIPADDPDRVYASEFGIVYRSDDAGRTWNDGTPIDARDILADPQDADTVYATTTEGLAVSRDGAAIFTIDPDAPRMVLIAAGPDGSLVGTGVDGTLRYQSPDGTWRTGAPIEGAVQALAVTPDGHILAADERGIVLYTTPDADATTLYRPEPHV